MFKKIAVAAALVAASSVSFAAAPTPFYAGVDVSSTKVDGFDDKAGYGAFIGYKLNDNVAVEGGIHRLADTHVNYDGYRADATVDQYDISLIGSVPLQGGFSLFGRIGYNRVDMEAKFDGAKLKDHANNAVYGMGLGYAFTPVVTGRLEVQKPDTGITKLVAGVAYAF
ncbi:MAG: porin family protein [Pseudomonadota bacterium]